MLYSYDIFDTIITRTTATPQGIFALIENDLRTNHVELLSRFQRGFFITRVEAETQARLDLKAQGLNEITFDDIYKVMGSMVNLDEDEIEIIKQIEFNLETSNSLPIEKTISEITSHLENGDRVVLISDMYLSSNQIRTILSSHSEAFEDIEIYVSSECQYTKASGDLYRYVRNIEKVEWEEWTHTGDNEYSDGEVFRKLGGNAVLVPLYVMSECEAYMLRKYNESAFVQLYIGLTKRLNTNEFFSIAEQFGCIYGASVLLGYSLWYLHLCMQEGIKWLYFIARDGYILKKITDQVIGCLKLQMHTKYIYGSRKAWNINEDKTKEELLRKYLLQEIDESAEKIGFVDAQGTGKTLSGLSKIIKYDRNKSIYGFYYQLINSEFDDSLKLYRYATLEQGVESVIELMTRAMHGETLGYLDEGGVVQPVLGEYDTNNLTGYEYDKYIDATVNTVKEYLQVLQKNKLDVFNFLYGHEYYQYLIHKESGTLLDFLCEIPQGDMVNSKKVIKPYAPKIDIAALRKQGLKSYTGWNINLSLRRHSDEEKIIIRELLDYDRKHRYSVDLNRIKDKVALYGSGVVGQSIYEQLKTNDRTSVVVWTDQKILCKEGIMDTVANLVKYDFDQIIIAVKSKMAVNDIMHELALLGYDEKIMYWEEF